MCYKPVHRQEAVEIRRITNHLELMSWSKHLEETSLFDKYDPAIDQTELTWAPTSADKFVKAVSVKLTNGICREYTGHSIHYVLYI